VADALRCRRVSGCDTLMLGRGMVSDPGLALAIVAADAGARDAAGLAWSELHPLLVAFWALVAQRIEPRARAGRLKQWLNYLRRVHPQAATAYAAVRTINDPQRVAEHLGLFAPSGAPRAEPIEAAAAPTLEPIT
jgi:tRNA-dihydrouridine synthase C